MGRRENVDAGKERRERKRTVMFSYPEGPSDGSVTTCSRRSTRPDVGW